MSTRWPGGIINGSAPVPTGGGAGDLAPGVWTLDQADQYIATQTWPGTGTPDPQFQYVTALLHGDGTNGGQNNTFLDSSSNNFTITRNGNTTQGSFSPYGDLWSNNFNGSSNLVTSSSQVIPSGSYTLEAWVFVTGTSATQTIFAQGTGTGDSARTFLGIEDNSGAKWAVQIGGTQAISTITPALNTWTHVAMTFNGSTMALYLNGTSIATASSSTNASNTTLQLGKNWGTYWFNGYISNARVSNTVRYTATFTPQTTPFVADANTVFLSCQANRFIDASTNNYALSVQNGSPSVQRFSPFQNLATYTPARVGGSGYFDGSGDYLRLADNSAFQLGNGDFTLETWVYLTATPPIYDASLLSYGTTGNFNGWQMSLSNAAPQGRIVFSFNFSTVVTSTLRANQNSWNHIAVSRSGNTLYLFVNGVLDSSNSFTATSNTGGADFAYINTSSYDPGSTDRTPTGYLAGSRLVKGTCLYTSTFALPTAPVSPVTNTSYLLGYTNGAIFDSDASNNFETVGNAQISTSVVKYGTGSISFDGSGDWLTAPNTPNLLLGSGNFTIECWINFNSLATNRGIIYLASTYDSLFSYGIQWASNTLYFWYSTNGGAASFVSAPWTPSTGIWYHLAVSRAGNSLFFFINGAQIGTTQSLAGVTLFATSANLLVGGQLGGSGGSLPGVMDGYIDDLRITNGYARYWYNFQAPTAPFPNYGGVLAPPVQDPLFAYNTLLLNGDGTNGAQNNTFLDSSTNNFTITRNGNTTQGSFSPYGDLWSNYFNGSNAYLTAPDNTNWQIGSTSTYSVEAWVNVGSTSAQSALFGALNRWWLGSNFTDVSGASGKFCFAVFNGSSWQTISSATTVVAGTWYHVAATFNNGTTRLYINGVQEATTTGVATNSASGSLFMGAILNPGYSYGLTGYLSNIRITKGSSLPYTANFTPSTTPLTAVSGTVLLTAQSNRFVDNSSNAYVITASGTPSVQRFSPFNPTAPYSTSVIGGSSYMDGTGDYLTTQATTSLNFGTNDFTVEGWIYTSSTSSTFIYSQCSPGAQRDGIVFGWNSASNLWWLFGDGSNWVFERTPAFSLRVNSWVHLAVVRQSGTARFYANGVQVDSIANTTNLTQASNISYIGGNPDGFVITGYISNFRIVNGSAVYPNGTTFTPPTAPVTNITNTQLLTNFTNAGIPDLAMQTNLETVGNAQVSTSVVKYGTGSLAFDGSGDYLTAPNNAIYNLGSGSWTIEFWINPTSAPGIAAGIIYKSSHSSNQGWWVIYYPNYIGFGLGSGSPIVQSATSSISVGTWTHVAIVNNSGTGAIYINGMQSGSTGTINNFTDSSTVLAIGALDTATGWNANYPFNGYLDDLRITRGIARYVQPFTPPTAALQTF